VCVPKAHPESAASEEPGHVVWCGYYTSTRITFKSTMAGGEKSSEKNSHIAEVLLLQAVVQQNSKIKFEPQWCKK
jgi:hypothetical protein